MPTVEERLVSLEARVDAMSDIRNLIAGLRGDMNARFGDMNARFGDLNARFGEINGRFDEINRRLAALDEKGDRHFTWMVSTQVALLLAVVGALVGAYYR
jgi:hypothetical protein